MARSRNIKPGFFLNDDLADCCPLTRLLFIGLWTLADCEGRLKNKPRAIKAQILPYDDCDIESMLQVLYSSGFIQIYTALEQPTIQIVNFKKHQNPHINEKKKGSELGSYEQIDIDCVKKQPHIKKHRTSTRQVQDKYNTDREESLLRKPSSLNEESGNKKKSTRTRFTKPSLEEVTKYCLSRNNNVDPSKWIDFYISNGWKVGKNPMRDWKACIRTWEKNSYSGSIKNMTKNVEDIIADLPGGDDDSIAGECEVIL